MRIILLSSHLLLVSLLFAQSEQSIKLEQQELYFPVEITPLSFKTEYQPLEFKILKYSKYPGLSTLNTSNDLQFTKLKKTTAFSFQQEKKEETYIGLGKYEHYKNTITINSKDKLIINLDIGLLKQNTIHDFDQINYHLSMHTLVEYKITKSLSAYMYGQYITVPLNKDKSSFNSFSHMNQLFLQTEIGGGLRAGYKNFKTDIGMKSTLSNQLNQLKSINTMDTKITIGF